MVLYKEHGVNPLAGCWPMVVQYPVIISVYYVVLNHKGLFANQNWLWIGSAFTKGAGAPAIFGTPVFAANLSVPDLVLILLYAFSMYLSIRFVQPAGDGSAAGADAAHDGVDLPGHARFLRLALSLAVGDGPVLVLL